MGDLITMDDLSNKEIENLLDNAERLLPVAKGDVHLPLLEGKVLANMFFENSTRTRPVTSAASSSRPLRSAREMEWMTSWGRLP